MLNLTLPVRYREYSGEQLLWLLKNHRFLQETANAPPWLGSTGFHRITFMKFKKRIFKSPKEFLIDFWLVARNAGRFKAARSKGLVPSSFMERLMLAVTAVNGCRYCSYFHARQAVKSGLSAEEICQLLAGDVAGCPADEAVALAYAQHWAESNAHPDAEAVRKLRETYGEAKAEAIFMALRIIRFGNLTGNTLDYLLYCLSFGKLRG